MGAYSNGYNLSLVHAALSGRLGWRQPTETAYAIVDNTNLASASGRYYDSFHSLVNAKNVKDTFSNPAASDAQFNTHLTNLGKDAIMRALNGVFNEPELLEQTMLFEREGRADSAITNAGNFVGYVINIPDEDNISVQIDSLTMLFDGAKTFTLYLFKDGKKTAVKSQSVTVAANEATVINLTDWVLSYIDNNSTASLKTKGGRFFFGYFQEDLGDVKAINEVADWEETKCFSALPFQSPKTTGTDFDRTSYSETFITHGMNLEMSAFRDFTNVIVKKAPMFDELIGLQMAYMVLEQILYCVRSNGGERLMKEQAQQFALQLELKGAIPISDSPQITGLQTRIDREAKRIKSSLFPKVRSSVINLADEC